MKKYARHIAIAFALVTIVAVTQLYRLRTSAKASRERQIAAKKELIELKSRQWKTNAFLPIIEVASSDLSFLQTALTNIDEQRRGKLIGRFHAFLTAYSAGSFDEYYAFKTSNYICSIGFDANVLKALEYHRKKGVLFPEDNYGRLKAFWHAASRERGNTQPARIVGIDLQSLNVVVNISTNSSSAAVPKALKLLNNLAASSCNTLIQYQETPARVASAGGTNCIALFSLVAEFSSSPRPGPIVVSFYWSSIDGQWVPWELVTDASSKFTLLF